jgi:3-oxoadipate enol-lactonase
MERVVQSGSVTLALEEMGEGIPVVLLHGLTGTRRYVVMGSRALERGGHRVATYDARGHGRSSPAPSPEAYGYETLADDLEAVLDSLDMPRAVLVGASMGAHTITRFAVERPERVAGAVFVTPAFDPTAPPDPASLARWDRLAAGLREGGVDGFLAAYGDPGAMRDTVLTVVRQRLSAHEHPEAVADALSAVPRSRPFESWEGLRALDVPALVVGSRDEFDPGHPLAVAEQWARELPRARLAVEEPGRSPLAWQGGQLSRLVAEVAAEGEGA